VEVVLDAKTSEEKLNPQLAHLNKQQRAQETRKQLMDAAREIFARGGFELTRLEDIAAAAGKTRGAFYAHFRDKEDIFFAIFEEDILEKKERMREPLIAATSGKERIEILVQHLAELIQRPWQMLLSLEFKAYAIRHPHHTRRLANIYTEMCLCCGEIRIDDLIPELRLEDYSAQRKQAAQFAALVDGLAINWLFDPENLDSELILKQLRSGIEAILSSRREDK
jgi:AcrR family transcriptional regulator